MSRLEWEMLETVIKLADELGCPLTLTGDRIQAATAQALEDRGYLRIVRQVSPTTAGIEALKHRPSAVQD